MSRIEKINVHSSQAARRRQRPDQEVLRVLLEWRRPQVQAAQGPQGAHQHRWNHHLESKPRGKHRIAIFLTSGAAFAVVFRAVMRLPTWRGTGWAGTPLTRRPPSPTWANTSSERGGFPSTTLLSPLQSETRKCWDVERGVCKWGKNSSGTHCLHFSLHLWLSNFFKRNFTAKIYNGTNE
jgi:hypothetical protein